MKGSHSKDQTLWGCGGMFCYAAWHVCSRVSALGCHAIMTSLGHLIRSATLETCHCFCDFGSIRSSPYPHQISSLSMQGGKYSIHSTTRKKKTCFCLSVLWTKITLKWLISIWHFLYFLHRGLHISWVGSRMTLVYIPVMFRVWRGGSPPVVCIDELAVVC